MAEDRAPDQVASQISWQMWLGLSLIAATVTTVAVLHFISPSRLLGSDIQLCVVLGFVAGSTLATVGLHASNRIGGATLERATLALAVAAIIFAIWQFRDARVQESKMEEVAQEMPTRFVGFFPRNMQDLIDVAKHAEKSLDIMTDFVGYGHYSAPRQFGDYLQAIESVSDDKGGRVRLLVYTRRHGSEVHNVQFTDDAFMKASRNRDSKLLEFCAKFNRGIVPKSKDEFDILLFQRQAEYMKELKGHKGVQIRVTDADLPFYVWDADDQDAVFSIFNADIPNGREAAFRTRDTSLIVEQFEVKFRTLWEKACDVEEVTNDSWSATGQCKAAKDEVVPRRLGAD